VAAIPHRNRGRPPAHALTAALRERVVALSRTTFAGANHSPFRDLLAEREGIVLALSAVRRIRRPGSPARANAGRRPTGSGGSDDRAKGCCSNSTAAPTIGCRGVAPA
jgi:hypothetical protein